MLVHISFMGQSSWLVSMSFDTESGKARFLKDKSQQKPHKIDFYNVNLGDISTLIYNISLTGSPGKAFNQLKTALSERREEWFANITKDMSKNDKKLLRDYLDDEVYEPPF